MHQTCDARTFDGLSVGRLGHYRPSVQIGTVVKHIKPSDICRAALTNCLALGYYAAVPDREPNV